MSIPRIVSAMEYIDDDLVSGAVTYTRTKKSNSWLKWGAMAACLCLVVVGAFIAGRISNDPHPVQRPISAYIQEDVSVATVYHTVQGKTAELVIEGEALESLRIWTNNLDYTLTADNGQEIPKNIETAETFKIVLEEGDYPGFSYFDCGENNCYLWIEGYWYTVVNPSNPPV
jgi:hypothetical protein